MRGEGRLTGALGGVGVKAGDCAGPGQASQARVYRLQKHGLALSKPNREMEQNFVFYFAFGADLTALGTAAAVALFHFPEHGSP